MKVIFLDIDGVLNGYNRATGLIYLIASKVHALRFVRKHHDLFGIRPSMVRRLSRIVKETGAVIVLSSSWRSTWYTLYQTKNERDKKLYDQFLKHNIHVAGTTPHLDGSHRGKEIKEWMNHCDNIESFIIIDDESFDLKDMYPDHLILTSTDGNIKGAWYENTGLKNRHVRQAIKMLNGE